MVGLISIEVWRSATSTATDALVTLSDTNLAQGADNLARNLQSVLQDAQVDATTAARLDLSAVALQTGDPKRFNWYTDELYQGKNRYAAVVLIEPAGKIAGVNSVRRDGRESIEPLMGRVVGEKWFKPTFKAGKDSVRWIPPSRPAFVEALLAPTERVVGYAMRIGDIMDDRIGVVVVLDALALSLNGYFEGSATEVSSLAYVVSSDGKAVFLPSALSTAAEWISASLPIRENQRSWTSSQGHDYHLVFTPIRSAPLGEPWHAVQLRRVSVFEALVTGLSQNSWARYFLLCSRRWLPSRWWWAVS